VNRICVFTGAKPGLLPEYATAAIKLGNELASRGYELVYGGAKVGLMGVIADAVLSMGGRVTGVIPAGLASEELAHQGLSELKIVASMHERNVATSISFSTFWTMRSPSDSSLPTIGACFYRNPTRERC
jgi:uncharacterized protein (TIGR00730 family)